MKALEQPARVGSPTRDDTTFLVQDKVRSPRLPVTGKVLAYYSVSSTERPAATPTKLPCSRIRPSDRWGQHSVAYRWACAVGCRMPERATRAAIRSERVMDGELLRVDVETLGGCPGPWFDSITTTAPNAATLVERCDHHGRPFSIGTNYQKLP